MSEVEVARLSHDEDPVPRGVDGASYAPRPGRYQEAFASNKGRTGLGLIALIVLAAVLGPIFLAHGPYEQGPDALTTPNGTHLLGTDEVGRDLLARVLAGTRVDLTSRSSQFPSPPSPAPCSGSSACSTGRSEVRLSGSSTSSLGSPPFCLA